MMNIILEIATSNLNKKLTTNLNKNKLLRSLNKLYYELKIDAWSYKAVGISSSGRKRGYDSYIPLRTVCVRHWSAVKTKYEEI